MPSPSPRPGAIVTLIVCGLLAVFFLGVFASTLDRRAPPAASAIPGLILLAELGFLLFVAWPAIRTLRK